MAQLSDSIERFIKDMMEDGAQIEVRRNELAQHLEKHGIQTRNLFAGNLTKHPCFEGLAEGTDYRVAGALTNTDRFMNDALWIGLYPGMTREKLDYMIGTICSFCKRTGL